MTATANNRRTRRSNNCASCDTVFSLWRTELTLCQVCKLPVHGGCLIYVHPGLTCKSCAANSEL